MRSARLNKQLTQPQKWQHFVQGQSLKKACSQVCNELASRMFGHYLVKLGPLSSNITLSECPIRHQVALSVNTSKAQVKGLSTELPLQGNSVDAFFLSLELDFASDPHRILREVDHCITANGHILLCGLNPFSISGLLKYLPIYRKHPLKQARFFSAMRTKDWLQLLHYEIIEERYLFHHSIFSKYDISLGKRADAWINKYLSPYLGWSGAAYCILAKKQTIPMTKVRKKWANTPKFVPVNAANKLVPQKKL